MWFKVRDITIDLFSVSHSRIEQSTSSPSSLGSVLVTKSPCLHPGDFRKLEAVDVFELRDSMRDCIVFSTQGKRPNFHECAGSDLDGDQYWVYWGDELKIDNVAQPLPYTPAQKVTVSAVTNDMIVEHFLDTLIDKAPGVIANTHCVIADKDPKGTSSEACKDCAILFARAIDARKTGENINMSRIKQFKEKYCQTYPAWMMKFDKPVMENPPSNSINEILFRKAVQARIRYQDFEDVLRPLPNVTRQQSDCILELNDDTENPEKELGPCALCCAGIFALIGLGLSFLLVYLAYYVIKKVLSH